MTIYKCSVCETIYDEEKEGATWEQLPDDWACFVCESGKSFWQAAYNTSSADSPDVGTTVPATVEDEPEKVFDDFEIYMADIHCMAETGESIIEPMRTKKPTFSWDEILIKDAQLAKIPLSSQSSLFFNALWPIAFAPSLLRSPVQILYH